MKYHDPQTGADCKLKDGVLFCSGTVDWTDMRQNLDFIPIHRNGAIGHRGSYEQALWISINVPMRGVTLIQGHSLGGAVALWLGLMTGIKVETFGAFRPFIYVKTEVEAINWINGFDPIPRIFWWRRYYGKVMRTWESPIGLIKAHTSYRW